MKKSNRSVCDNSLAELFGYNEILKYLHLHLTKTVNSKGKKNRFFYLSSNNYANQLHKQQFT